jgi:hypothetical protein
MVPVLSDNEAACLDVAIDLFERSDAYAASEPRLSRQYARQAYQLAALSPMLRESIVQERIRMIIARSGQRRIKDALATAAWSGGGRHRRLKQAGLMMSLLLAALLLHSTPVVEPADERIELAARTVGAPL